MTTVSLTLILISLALVMGSFALGLSAFVREGQEHRLKSQKYMRARVALQGLAVICFVLALILKG